MPGYVTRFGSLASYDKGGIEVIDDDPRHYVFSNMFEVAHSSGRPLTSAATAPA